MGTNEEITSFVDKMSDLGTELKLDSYSPHMLSLSVVGTDFFFFLAINPYSCFVIRSLVLEIQCFIKTLDISFSLSLTLPI